MRNPHLQTIVWFLALCVGMELAVGWMAPLPPFANSPPPVRNETPLRHWPEYTEGVLQQDRLLVYLGNSQAVGPEFGDASFTYPARLKTSLESDQPDLVMENWSVSGLNAENLELLSLQAIQRHADLLVVAVSMPNFEGALSYRFGRDRTDIQLLAGRATWWPELEHTFIGPHISWQDRFTRLFQLETHFGRGRLQWLDWLAQRFPRSWHVPLFGHVRSRSAAQPLSEIRPAAGPDQPPAAREETSYQSADQWEVSLRQQNLPRLLEVYRHLDARLRQSDTQLLWIWVPSGINNVSAPAVEGGQRIVDEFCVRLNDDGWQCRNLTRALAPELFFPSTFSSHLTRSGHDAMAVLVEPILRRAVH